MSAGAVFQIISNDGKADKMIMATDLLDQRIKQIREENRARVLAEGGDPDQEDLDPTLAEIGETHIIHYQSKFKPFVAIGMEYQKLVPQAGGGGLFGGQVTFSLAQFGDFFTDMALCISVSQASAQEKPVPALPMQSTPDIVGEVGQVNNKITLANGQVINTIEPSEHVIRKFDYFGQYSHTGKLMTPQDQVADFVYYCDFPGERLLKSVAFEINGNPLDDYDSYSYVFYRNFKLKEDKKVGYYRCVGQELPVEAQSVCFKDGARYGGYILNGLQTPKKVQPEFQIWQKLLFWFNLDFSLALPSAAIPFGQRFINIQLESAQKMLFRAPALHTIVKITNQYVPGSQFPLAVDGTYNLSGGNLADVRNTWFEYVQLPVFTNGDINYPTIKDMNLYVNNIFTHPSMHDLYIKRIGFYLVRVHRRQRSAMNQPDLNLLMNNFKYPIEYIYAGLIPDENTSGQWQATDWHQFCKVTHNLTKGSVYLTQDAGSVFDSSKLHWTEKQRTIDHLEVTAHGVSLYQKIDSRFYNQYKPGVFGNHTIVTPKDQGLAFINFALFPGIFQPSGHINVSRAREFYIHVYSSVIGQTGQSGVQAGQLITEASALNFLLISDGSAVLRYST